MKNLKVQTKTYRFTVENPQLPALDEGWQWMRTPSADPVYWAPAYKCWVADAYKAEGH